MDAADRDGLLELVSQITRALVDLPGSVTVEATETDHSTTVFVRVDPSDLGKVIGRQGRTARSIRIILDAASRKYHHRFLLEVVDGPDAPGRTDPALS